MTANLKRNSIMSLIPCYVAGWCYVPTKCVSEAKLAYLEKVLKIIPRRSSEYETNFTNINLLGTVKSKKGEDYFSLPINFAFNYFGRNNLLVKDNTVLGVEDFIPPKLPDPNHPRASANQKEFMADMLEAVKKNYTVLAIAPTGTGKTVTALNTAGKLGHKTLVIVHLERLMSQWVDEIELQLGIPKERIGIVRQDVCEYEGKDVVVALMHSLGLRKYPKEFYSAFGTVIYDEGHRLGAPLFASTVGLFPARYKICLTATPKRKDGCEDVFFYYFGKPRVIAQAEALPIDVKVLKYTAPERYRVRVPNRTSFLLAVANDEIRTRKIAKLIHSLYLKDSLSFRSGS